MSYVLFALAQNQEAQDRLRSEIRDFEEGKKITYEELSEMSYLNACIYGK